MEVDIKNGLHPNGHRRHEKPYHRGKLHGVVKLYYPDGTLYREISYYQGERQGVIRWYHESGELNFEYYYLYGRKVTPEEYRKHELTVQLSRIS